MRSFRLVVPAAGLATALAVVVGGAAAAQSPSPDALEESATAIEAPSAAPQLDWETADGLPETIRYSPISSLTANDNGSMLAAGDWAEDGKWKSIVWQSPDGDSWTRVQLAGADRTVDAAPFGDGFAVTGYSYDFDKQRGDGFVWLSDDGLEWPEPVKIPNVMPASIHASPEGLVIFGSEPVKKDDVLGAWHSVDGETWERSDILKAIGPRPGAAAVSEDGTWVLFGTALDGRTEGRKDHLWRSADGQSWNKVRLPVGPKDWKNATMRDILSTGDGFLATYAHMNDKPASAGGSIWFSADGETWEKVHTTKTFVTEIEAVDGGYVAFTEPLAKNEKKFRKNAGQVLISADGHEWQSVATDEFINKQVHGAAATPDGQIVVLGGSSPERTTDLMWLGNATELSLEE